MITKLEQIRLERINELRIYLDKARKNATDLTEVFTKFRDEFYRIIKQNWGMRGTMFGSKWKPLSPRYKEWKLKHYGTGEANLILTGRLYSAATGDSPDSVVKIEKTKMFIGIRNISYANIHQNGGFTGRANMPQRPYFLMKDRTIHPRLERFLRESVEEYFDRKVTK